MLVEQKSKQKAIDDSSHHTLITQLSNSVKPLLIKQDPLLFMIKNTASNLFLFTICDLPLFDQCYRSYIESPNESRRQNFATKVVCKLFAQFDLVRLYPSFLMVFALNMPWQ